MNKNAKKRIELIRTALVDIKNIYGHVTAKNFVEYSKDENSPTHKMFDWDIDAAAQKYWEWQARQMISEVKITIESNGKNVEVREYANVEVAVQEKDTYKTERVYENIEVISKDEDLRMQMVENAKKDALTFKNKYNTLSDIVGLIAEIDKFLEYELEAV